MLEKSYNPNEIEKKYYAFWEHNGFFDAKTIRRTCQ